MAGRQKLAVSPIVGSGRIRRDIQAAVSKLHPGSDGSGETLQAALDLLEVLSERRGSQASEARSEAQPSVGVVRRLRRRTGKQS